MEDIKGKLDEDGKVKKADFIEHSIDVKLLDLTDISNARKTVAGTPRRTAGKGTSSQRMDTRVRLFFVLKIT